MSAHPVPSRPDEGPTLVHALRAATAERPDATAVIAGATRLTYRELDAASDDVAAALAHRGVGPADRVAFLGRESHRYWATLLAAAKLGVVLVPVNWRLSRDEIAHVLRDSNAAAVFADADQVLPDDVATEVIRLDDPSWALTVPAGAATREPLPVDGDTPIAQLYTSGTTGLPKGVVLAHRSFTAVLRSLAEHGLDWIEVQPDDVCLIGIPGFHVGGLWFAAQAFNAGASVLSLDSFEPAAALRAIEDEGVTRAIVVPAMIRSLLAAPGFSPERVRSLRQVIYGGAPISDTLLQQAIREFGCRFAQIYGLTETGNTAICLPPGDHVVGSPRLRAAGLPYPCVEVRVVDPEDGAPLPVGASGEVWLRSPAAMVEYWANPEATARTLVDGWVRTGDVGVLDEDGYLYLRDRLNDMIVVGGENVYPAEVENVIATHPAVADVAVVGVPDETTGESIVAYVQPRPGSTVTSRDLVLHLRDRVAAFKLPRAYEVVDEIPRNPSGKILRRTLRDPHWSGRDRRVN